MKCLQTIISMLILMTFCGCYGNAQNAQTNKSPDAKSIVKIGEKFRLKTDESAKVEKTGIEIIVNRIGRKWLADGGGESLDFTFSVNYGGKSKTYTHPLPPLITSGKYKVEVVKTEPFGDGFADFVVTKNDATDESDKKNNSSETEDSINKIAAKFLARFDFHIDEKIAPEKNLLEFPQNFRNLPFFHYQAASERIGLDLTPLLGRKVEIVKYTLKEKQFEKKEEITIFAHLIIENGEVVGAWMTDSSANAPGIYSFVK